MKDENSEVILGIPTLSASRVGGMSNRSTSSLAFQQLILGLNLSLDSLKPED